MRLRQVALVAHDLGSAESDVAEQLGLSVCFRDPGVATFGLENALFAVGDTFLEVVSPNRGQTTAGRLLERRGGDGGYMVLIQVDDLDEMRRRLFDAEARVVFEAEGPGVSGLHIHPRDIGGAIVSIDQTDVWEEWPWAGTTWREQPVGSVVSAISAVEIEAEDPIGMARRWAEVLGIENDSAVLTLDEGAIRFVSEGGRGEGVAVVEYVGTGPERFETVVCGTRMKVVARR